MDKQLYDINAVDLAWVAGFLEGEGSFLRCGNTICVSATQVELFPIEKLVHLFGGNDSTYQKKEIRSNGGQYHRWQVYGVEAAQVMLLIYGLMSPKRKQQILRCFYFWSDRPGSNNRGGFSKDQQDSVRSRVREALSSLS